MALKLRRGTDAQRLLIIPQEGEIIYTTDTKELYAGDGVTVGGNLITGSVANSPAALTRDLDLDSYDIIGAGDINITGTVTADFNGNLVGNVVGNVVGDVVGSVFADDSTPMLDAINNSINATSITTEQFITVTDRIEILPLSNSNVNPQELRIISNNERSILKLTRASQANISLDALLYGGIFFERTDINGDFTTGFINGLNDRILISSDVTGTFDAASLITIFNGRLGVGTFEPTTKVEIKNGSLRFNESRSIESITSPTTSEVTFNITTNRLNLYDGVEWREVITSTLADGITDLPGPIAISGVTEITKDSFGNDSTVITGFVIYNTTSDRFEFFQAGSWIPLPNQVLEETSDVRFKSVTSATNLDLQAGNAVRVIGAPLRLANLTTTQRNALTAANGDMIYNTTENRIQAYQNSAWINLDDGTVA